MKPKAGFFLKTNKIDISLARLIKDDQITNMRNERDMITNYADDIKRIIQNYSELYAKKFKKLYKIDKCFDRFKLPKFN